MKNKKSYTGWNDFGVEEYVLRNYGQILNEDKLIIQNAIQALKDADIKFESLTAVADIGTGPNLYPAMILAPYVADNGTMHLIEYSQSNRIYLESLLANREHIGSLNGVWDKFKEFMTTCDSQWSNTLEMVKTKARVSAGDIYKLPEAAFDAVSSYFVSESITDDLEQFEEAIESLIRSVKPGGFIMVAHMLGSSGWPAGEHTSFPAVSITIEDLKRIYAAKANVKVIEISAKPQAREGYHGMALVIGKKY